MTWNWWKELRKRLSTYPDVVSIALETTPTEISGNDYARQSIQLSPHDLHVEKEMKKLQLYLDEFAHPVMKVDGNLFKDVDPKDWSSQHIQSTMVQAGSIQAGKLRADPGPSISQTTEAISFTSAQGERYLTISYDGKVTMKEGTNPDVAAKQFWDAVLMWAPLSTNRCKHCKERRAEHSPEGKCLFDTTFFEEDVSFDRWGEKLVVK